MASAAEQDAWSNIEIRLHAAGQLRLAYSRRGFGAPVNEAEAEKWKQRAGEAWTEKNEREKAERQKRIEEHEAMIPQ